MFKLICRQYMKSYEIYYFSYTVIVVKLVQLLFRQNLNEILGRGKTVLSKSRIIRIVPTQ